MSFPSCLSLSVKKQKTLLVYNCWAEHDFVAFDHPLHHTSPPIRDTTTIIHPRACVQWYYSFIFSALLHPRLLLLLHPAVLLLSYLRCLFLLHAHFRLVMLTPVMSLPLTPLPHPAPLSCLPPASSSSSSSYASSSSEHFILPFCPITSYSFLSDSSLCKLLSHLSLFHLFAASSCSFPILHSTPALKKMVPSPEISHPIMSYKGFFLCFIQPHQ